MVERKFSDELKVSLKKYLYSDKAIFESKFGDCPICQVKMRNNYRDTVGGMESESCDVCDICGFTELFAYGNYETSFDGLPVPESVAENRILLAILRKLVYFEMPLSSEEKNMVEILLEGKDVSEEEFEQLQKKIAEENHQVKGIESIAYFKQKNPYAELSDNPYEDDSFGKFNLKALPLLDELFSQLEPLDF